MPVPCRCSLLFVLFVSCCLSATYAQSFVLPDSFKLVYEQDFESPQALRDFTMTDPNAWQVRDTANQRSLDLFGKSDYQGPVRSPFNIALLNDLYVGDFALSVRLAQTGREYGHRDLCLFFNFVDAANFYYVHLATKPDDHANNIFLVDNEPRVKISTKTSSGTDWGATGSWHEARIIRRVATGEILIYFDDWSAPAMVAKDTHFRIGRLGVGSFDDTGRFDDIRVWAPKTYTPTTHLFQPFIENQMGH